jgi:uncharacterized glyoxalase superfamily protein PhnB
MNVTGITPILNVSDVPASLEWFHRLGWKTDFTYNQGGQIYDCSPRNAHGPATFAGVRAGEARIFLCQDGQGLRGGKPARFDGDDDVGATWMSIWLKTPGEVDEAHQRALDAGITVIWPPTNEPWGARECRIMHPDGHVFRISAPIEGG